MSNKRSLLTMATRRNGCNDRLGKQCLPDFTVHSFTSVFSIRFFHSELKQKASINFKRHFHSKTSSSDSAVNSKTTPVIDFVRPQQSSEIEWIRVNWNHRHNGIQWMRLKNLIETEFWFCRLVQRLVDLHGVIDPDRGSKVITLNQLGVDLLCRSSKRTTSVVNGWKLDQ